MSVFIFAFLKPKYLCIREYLKFAKFNQNITKTLTCQYKFLHFKNLRKEKSLVPDSCLSFEYSIEDDSHSITQI